MEVLFVDKPVTDDILRHVQHLIHLRDLTILVTVRDVPRDITDAGIERLKGLKKLEILAITGPKITDAGLRHLIGLANLRRLDLPGTSVTDAGLEHLKGLKNLHYIWLSESTVTKAGVRKLQQALPNCKIYH